MGFVINFVVGKGYKKSNTIFRVTTNFTKPSIKLPNKVIKTENNSVMNPSENYLLSEQSQP